MLRLIKLPIIRFLKAALPRLHVDFLEAALYRSILRTKFAALRESKRIEKREHVWDFAIQTIGAERKVLFLELGVWEGYSIMYFASKLPSAGSRFYGFDSFEGLPEKWGRNRVGTFSTGGQVPAVEDSRISFVKGWFQDTLPAFAVDGGEFDVVLVHLDADLYSSTLFALMDLWRRFDSFYVIFDEFINHETRAFYNFSQCCPCRIEFLAHDHELPSRVFCKVTVQRTAQRT